MIVPKIRTCLNLLSRNSLRAFGSRRFVIMPKSVNFLSLHISVEMEENRRNAVVFVSFFSFFKRKEKKNTRKTNVEVRR